MESLVFRDSPLAEYLEGEGEHEADWSAVASDNTDASSTSSIPPPLNFAPPSTLAPRARKKSLRPLEIQQPGWYRSTKLKEVLSGGLKSRLAAGENLQFVERFRYVLVASQLLNEQASVANYDYVKDASPTSKGRLSPGSGLVTPFPVVAWFGSPSPRFYTYMAASIIVLSILVSWLSRGGAERKLTFGKSRTTITLLLTMVLALLVFAHVRRKKLRHLRTDAISAAEEFVENCQMFDMVTGNAITLIQEIELVSRGYRLSQPLPPITRLERADNTRKCARLRRTIIESFRLSIPPTSRAIEALASYPKLPDLEKFYDIYDIRVSDLQEAGIGIDETEFDDMESLKALKTLFQRLYVIRKIFICHLLALEARGGHGDHLQWHAVAAQLRLIGGLMADLCIEIKDILNEETDFKLPPTPKMPTAGPNKERLRQQLRRFNSLSTTVRGLQAKMHLLREGTDRALQTTQELEGFGPELLMQYDEIGEDLRGLVAEWESGRSTLAGALEKNGTASPAGSRPVSLIFTPGIGSPGMSTAGTLVGGSPRTSGSWDESDRDAILRKRISTGSDFLRAPASDEEEIFEAISEPKVRERSKMTREERILKMKEDRQKALEAKKQAEANVSLVRELRDVLENRPQLKRRSLPAKSRLSLELIKVPEANVIEGRQSAPITPIIIPMSDSPKTAADDLS
ncbi:hypothetical protein ABW19_dt0207690 [Dactylella cylindrospora]|nr:hypothetical protein ABW19_dt0207690 [Dactylella cylindrospora]